MKIDKVALRDVDPLKVLTEKSLFTEEEKEEEEKEDERENDEENQKIVEIWNSLTKETEHVESGSLASLFKPSPNLQDLATLLNRSDVQIMIADVLEKERKANSERERRKGFIVRKNLEKLNGKIEKENSVWFRRIPLLFRILSQISKINIPKVGRS